MYKNSIKNKSGPLCRRVHRSCVLATTLYNSGAQPFSAKGQKSVSETFRGRAKQVRQLSICPIDKCTKKFTNMTCTVKHKVNIKSYALIVLQYCYNSDTFFNGHIAH